VTYPKLFRKHRRAIAALGLAFGANLCFAADSPIATLASTSSCAKHIWADRGRAPLGFIKGVALVYSRRYCELRRHTDTAVTVMAGHAVHSAKDALNLYGKAGGSDVDRLRAVFALAMGEGMRESSGNTTEGYDKTVCHQTVEIAEAGLFQVSHDSLGRSVWQQRVIDQYAASPSSCLLDTFLEGVRPKTIPVVGVGPGAEFQTRMKSCPALATDYAVIMFRVDRSHFGPITRKEAELVPECEDLLRSIEKEADANCP